MSQPTEPTDDDIAGTSEPTISIDDVQAARDDAGARDLVGATGEDGADLPDGAYGGDGPIDPADQAVIEAGGGVAEGFEQSEAALIENATDSEGSTRDILFDAIDEADDTADPDVYGEADDVRVEDDA